MCATYVLHSTLHTQRTLSLHPIRHAVSIHHCLKPTLLMQPLDTTLFTWFLRGPPTHDAPSISTTRATYPERVVFTRKGTVSLLHALCTPHARIRNAMYAQLTPHMPSLHVQSLYALPTRNAPISRANNMQSFYAQPTSTSNVHAVCA